MAIQTQRYIRKPVYVEAVRITSANFDEIVAWCQGEIHEEAAKGPGLFKKVIKVRVQHPKNPRQTKAYVGDWLLYTDTGYKVYTNKAFRASFDLMTETKTAAQAAEDERAEEVEREEGTSTPIPAQSDISMPTEPEVVEATPEAIARAVQETESARKIEEAELLSFGSVDADPDANNGIGRIEEAVDTYQGRRILSVKEQEELTVEEVRTLVQSGEAVLVQDVPRSS